MCNLNNGKTDPGAKLEVRAPQPQAVVGLAEQQHRQRAVERERQVQPLPVPQGGALAPTPAPALPREQGAHLRLHRQEQGAQQRPQPPQQTIPQGQGVRYQQTQRKLTRAQGTHQ